MTSLFLFLSFSDRNNANDANDDSSDPSLGRHSIHSAESFFSWFHDAKGVNVNIPGTLELALSEDGWVDLRQFNFIFAHIFLQTYQVFCIRRAGSTYVFDSLNEPTLFPGSDRGQFLRLNGKGFGNEGNYGNFGFTTELHTTFFYFGNEQFEFSGAS